MKLLAAALALALGHHSFAVVYLVAAPVRERSLTYPV